MTSQYINDGKPILANILKADKKELETLWLAYQLMQIDTLKELHKTVINHVVTGKIKVTANEN